MVVDILLFEGDGKKFGFNESYVSKILDGKTKQDLRKKIDQAKKPIIVLGNPNLNRFILSNKKVDVLLDPHNNAGEDFMNYRNSGMNHVLAKLANDNKIAIGFSLTSILDSKEKSKIIGKIMQNIRLCRKYRVNMIFASFAREETEQRQSHDLKSVAVCLKMTPAEAKKSMEFAEEIFKN